MNKIMMIVALVVPGGLIGGSALMDRFLDGIASIDVLPEEDPVPTTLLADYPGIVLFEGVENDADFVRLLEATATNLAYSATIVTNEDAELRLSTAMMLLGQYSLTNSLPVFEAIVTNGLAVDVVPDAAFYLGEANGIMSGPLRGWLENAWSTLPFERRAKAYAGVFRGLNSRISTSVETNRVVSIALTCLGRHVAWKESDCEVCYLWPAYATSSNRYVAAQLAREANPPCASSNYLARVIAGLEALPPGTMQMLSTNHLGQAWQE